MPAKKKWKCSEEELRQIKVPAYLADYLVQYAEELDSGQKDDDVQILIRDNRIESLEKEVELLRSQLKEASLTENEEGFKIIDISGIHPLPLSKGYALSMRDLVSKGYVFSPSHFNNRLYLE